VFINNKAVSLGIVVIASLIIGLIVFAVIIIVFNVSVPASLSDLFTAFRASSGTGMDVQGMLYQCEIKCLNADLKFNADTIKNSPFCTYTAEIDGNVNHCYNDYSNDPVVFECKAHLSDGTEVTNFCS